MKRPVYDCLLQFQQEDRYPFHMPGHKRQLENETSNHDQQVMNETIVFAVFKKEEGNEWENVNEILHVGEQK